MSLSVIPNKIELNQSEEYILNKIRKLYIGIEREVILYLEPKIRNLNPDFILIDEKFGIAIIEVKAWSYNYIKQFNQKEVQTSDGRKYENPTYKARRYFNTLKSIFSFDQTLLNDEAEFKYNLVSNLFFTTLDEGLEFSEVFNHFPVQVFYQNQIPKISIQDLFKNKTSNILKEDILSIRSLIFPEVKILQEVKEKQLEDVEEYSIKALSSDQEAFVKRKINGHYHVSGVPGSGKTVMLLSRAIYILKENPKWNVGIITYNKSLATKIGERLNSLSQDLEFAEIPVKNIEIRTFHDLAIYFANIQIQQNDDFWNEVLPREALKKVSPLYDAILIDEYQDFKKDWIELCIKTTKTFENKKNIFFAGDRLQSIYNKNEIKWKQDFNLNMTGRSKLLKTSYRTSKIHIQIALEVLKNEPSLNKEVLKFYEGFDGIKSFNKNQSSLSMVHGYYSNVIKKIHELLKAGYKVSDFLILVDNWKTAQKIKSYFPPEIQNSIITSKDVVSDKMVITSHYSSKGLENRVAVIFHFDKISDRKLAYVTLTRASEKLIIHYSNLSSPIVQEVFDLAQKFK
jgi:hypothetical protein